MRRPHRFKQYTKDHGYYSLYLIAIKSDGKICSPVKIGIADDPVRRLSGMQKDNFLKLVIYAHWWVAGRIVAARAEKNFKVKHRGQNIRGEWFDMEPDEAVRLAGREISDIGAAVFTEEELIEKMKEAQDRVFLRA